MSIISGSINEGEQAGEKLTDHVQVNLLDLLDALFRKIWATRIVIEVQERK